MPSFLLSRSTVPTTSAGRSNVLSSATFEKGSQNDSVISDSQPSQSMNAQSSISLSDENRGRLICCEYGVPSTLVKDKSSLNSLQPSRGEMEIMRRILSVNAEEGKRRMSFVEKLMARSRKSNIIDSV